MATVAANGGSREARRRRIVERGSDRLALITGRIQSLPPDSDQSRTATCPPSQTPADVAQHENVASGSPLTNLESCEEPCQRHIIDEIKEPLLENNDKGKTILYKPSASLGVEEEKSQISEEHSQISPYLQIPAQVHQIEHSHPNSFTTGQISNAITVSENIRMYCSVAAAILVILSYIEFPTLGCRIIRSVVIFKPLYLLLLTNISIVLGRIILGTRGSELRTGQMSSGPKIGGNDLVDRLGKALESGLLLQKMFEAMFIDFGIYAIVLVCGLTLVRILGW